MSGSYVWFIDCLRISPCSTNSLLLKADSGRGRCAVTSLRRSCNSARIITTCYGVSNRYLQLRRAVGVTLCVQAFLHAAARRFGLTHAMKVSNWLEWASRRHTHCFNYWLWQVLCELLSVDFWFCISFLLMVMLATWCYDVSRHICVRRSQSSLVANWLACLIWVYSPRDWMYGTRVSGLSRLPNSTEPK